MNNEELLKQAKELGLPADLIEAAAAEMGVVPDDDIPEVEMDNTSELFAILREAEELGLPADLIRAAASEMGLGESYRANLEADKAEADAAQADAARRLQGSSDSVGENLLEGAAEIAKTANSAAVFMGDVVTSPVRLLGKQTGLLSDDMNSIADLFPEGMQPGRGEFMEEREAAPYVGLAGDALAMGAGMAPIARAQGAGSAAAEAFGFGMTDDAAGAASRAAQINIENAGEINRLNTMNPEEYFDDLERSGTIDLQNKEQVQHFANKINDEQVYNANADRLDSLVEQEKFVDDYSTAFTALDEESAALEKALPNLSGKEKAGVQRRIDTNEARRLELEEAGNTKQKIDAIEKKINKQRSVLSNDKATLEQVEEANASIKELIKEQRKARKAAPKKVRYNDGEGKTQKLEIKYNPTVEKATDLTRAQSTIQRMADQFNVSYVDAGRAITRAGGLKPAANFRELADRQSSSMKELFDGGDGSAVSLADGIWRPTTALMRDKVGKGAARDFEQAFESAARDGELLYRNYVNNPGVSRQLSDWMDTSDVKRRFLNLHKTGKAGLNELKAMSSKLDPEAKQLFDQLIKDSEAHRAKASKLYKKEAKEDAVYWASQRKSKDPSTLDKVKGYFNKREPNKEKMEGTNERFRGNAFDMSDEALAEYENPMIAQLARMNEEITGMHLADRFNVRGAVGKNGDMGDMFDEVERVAAASGAGPEKAAIMRGLIADTFAGQKASPNSYIQTFMKQSYAGTLGQVDSAMMNLHDVAVSAWRMGAKNTAKGLWDSVFDGAGEVDLRRMGITNTNSSVGEFREGVGRALEKTGGLEKAADWYQDVAFKYSGFQMMDRMGKGTTMRAALHSFRDDASKRSFVRDYAHLVKPAEAAQVKGVLANGTKLSDMTAKQQEIVERMMFAKLGEQQLISAAGRPLLYLRNPNARPLWAMTGFAIKQADMLKMAVYDEARRGNFKKAGEAAVGYMTYVAVGYALVDTVRDMPAFMLTGDDKKAPTTENFVSRVADQPLAAMTLNRLDTGTFGRTASDPAGELMKSAVPPTGLVGNVGKDIGRAITGKEFRGYVLKSVPGGDFLYDKFNN